MLREHTIYNNFYKEIFKEKRIIIYGTSEKGIELYNLLLRLNCIEALVGDGNNLKFEVNVPIWSFNDFFKNIDSEKHIVVISGNDNEEQLFSRQLIGMGLREGHELFFINGFTKAHFEKYCYYSFNKIFIPFLSCQVTDICNLRCKGCAAWTMYRENPHDREFEKFKKNIDDLFKYVDLIELLDVCGGEPFIMDEFYEYVNYIGQYKEKIIQIRTVTNGTTIPNDHVCEALKNNNVKVVVDDYRENVETCRETFERVIRKLEEHNIRYEVRKVTSWCDIGFDKNIEKNELLSEIIFCECANYVKSFDEGKLYSCDYAGFASVSNVIELTKDDYYIVDDSCKKDDLAEFLLAKRVNGGCVKCNGYPSINKCRQAVAVQES